jgi:hypothetical protein
MSDGSYISILVYFDALIIAGSPKEPLNLFGHLPKSSRMKNLGKSAEELKFLFPQTEA